MRVKVEYTITGSYFLSDSEVKDIAENADIDMESDSEENLFDAIKDCEESGGMADNVDVYSDGKMELKVSKIA